MRFLFYSHDGLGLGHTRRHLAVARALSELAPQASILIATGTDDASRIGLPAHVEILKLPGLRKIHNGEYGSRRLRIPTAEIRDLRANLLLTTVKSFRPDVLLVDRHPLGAKGELLPALAEHRLGGGRAVLGFRDILDDREGIMAEWVQEHVQQSIANYYDELLVYGVQAVFDPVMEYDLLPAIRDRTHFCGYLINPTFPPNDRTHAVDLLKKNNRPVVLATAGGGEDGYLLLETFIQACKDAPWQGAIVTGPMLDEQKIAKLQQSGKEADVIVHTFVPHLADYFSTIDALVTMGGYNTLAEAVATGVPTVCVPRVSPRTEQLLRAMAFQKLGLLDYIHPDKLNEKTLGTAIASALGRNRDKLCKRTSSLLKLDGSHEAAQRLVALAGNKLPTSIR